MKKAPCVWCTVLRTYLVLSDPFFRVLRMVITKIVRFWLYGFGHRKTTARRWWFIQPIQVLSRSYLLLLWFPQLLLSAGLPFRILFSGLPPSP